jgi:lipid-binding SYLF domain-containing protein
VIIVNYRLDIHKPALSNLSLIVTQPFFILTQEKSKGGTIMKRLFSFKKVPVMSMIIVVLLCGGLAVGVALAKTGAEIDADVDAALEQFHQEVKGGAEFVKSAKGVLVMPKLTKGAFIVGGQYGTGALRVGGKTVNYYNSVAGSIGLSIGGERYNFIICFMTDESLQNFQSKSGWEAGVDGNVAVFTIGAGGKVDTTVTKSPIVAFVFGAKGLIGDASVKGAKFTKIVR